MFLFCLVFAMFCARLFICALWSPAGKGLTSWLSFVVSSVSLSLSHWYPGSGVVLDCIDSWSLQPYYFQQCGLCNQQRLRPACAYAQSDQSLCWSLEYSMSVKLLTEHHLEFLSLKGGCTGSSKSTPVKMPHCWKSHVVTSSSQCVI